MNWKLGILIGAALAIIFLSGCTLPAGTTITLPAERCGDGECGLCENTPTDPACGPTANFCDVDCGSCSDTDAKATTYPDPTSKGLNYYLAGTVTDARGGITNKSTTLYKDFIVGEGAVTVPLGEQTKFSKGEKLYISSTLGKEYTYTILNVGTVTVLGATVGALWVDRKNDIGTFPKGTKVETRKPFADSCAPDGKTLTEGLCYRNNAITTSYKCTNGCSNGRCNETGSELVEFCAYNEPQYGSRAVSLGQNACSPTGDNKLYTCAATKPVTLSALYKDFIVGESAVTVPLGEQTKFSKGEKLYISSTSGIEYTYTIANVGTVTLTLPGQPYTTVGALWVDRKNDIGTFPKGTKIETRKADWKLLEDCKANKKICVPEASFCVPHIGVEMVWETGDRQPYNYFNDICPGYRCLDGAGGSCYTKEQCDASCDTLCIPGDPCYRCLSGTEIGPACYTKEQCDASCSTLCINIPDTKARLPKCDDVGVIINGDPLDKLDVTFIPVGFEDMSEFDSLVLQHIDAAAQYEGLLYYEPFKSNRTKFNFRKILHLSPEIENNFIQRQCQGSGWEIPGVDNSGKFACANEIKNWLLENGCVYDKAIVIYNAKLLVGGGWADGFGGSIAISPEPRITVHEFGHLFGLADEAIYGGESIYLTGWLSSLPNCDTAGCSKWCQDYIKTPSGTHYDLCKNLLENDCKSNVNCSWRTAIDEFYKTNCVPIDDHVNIGINCLGGVGCYHNCYGVGAWRPADYTSPEEGYKPTSIMFYNLPNVGFDAVDKRHLESVLSGYK